LTRQQSTTARTDEARTDEARTDEARTDEAHTDEAPTQDMGPESQHNRSQHDDQSLDDHTGNDVSIDGSAHGSGPNLNLSHDVDQPIGFTDGNIAQLKEALTKTSQKISALTLEMVQLDNSVDSVEYQTRISARITALTKVGDDIQRAIATFQASDQPQAGSSAPPLSTTARDSTADTRTRLPDNLPTFRCGDHSVDNPEDFLRRFERVLDAQGFNIDRHWHRLLRLCLSEPNVRWIEAHLPSSMDWRSVTRAFTDQFGDPDRLINARVDLFKIQMRHGESITEYS